VSLDTTTVALDITVEHRNRDFLDHERTPLVRVVDFATEQFLADTVGTGRIRYLSHSQFSLPDVRTDGFRYGPDEAYPIPTTGLLVQTAHACFATHRGFGLNPDTIWQTIVNQVAEHIKQDPCRYADLFTWFPGQKAEVDVRDDELLADGNWLRALGKFEEQLRFLVGNDLVSLFMPRFSTTGQLERVAALTTFMGAASPYYKYSVNTMCHIPLIRLEGTRDDWSRLYRHTSTLAGHFEGLREYFAALLPVLQEISETANGKQPDNTFWSSAYKFKSSSGQQDVTGWLTALMAFKYGPDGPKPRQDFDWRNQIKKPWEAFRTNEIPSLLSTVPFTWRTPGGNIPMTFVAGALGVSSRQTPTVDVYTPRLGIAVMDQ
jgi:hypothetical protein